MKKTQLAYFDLASLAGFFTLLLINFFENSHLRIFSPTFLCLEALLLSLSLGIWLFFAGMFEYSAFYAWVLVLCTDWKSPFWGHHFRWLKALGFSEKISAFVVLAEVFILFFLLQRIIVRYLNHRKASIILLAYVMGALLTEISLFGWHSFHRPKQEVTRSTEPERPVQQTQGNFYYFILDAHLGLESFPEDIPQAQEIKAKLIEKYLQDGFRIYGGAHSNHYTTWFSLASLMGGKTLETNLEPIPGAASGLKKNHILETVLHDGYRAELYQTNYLNFAHGFPTDRVIARTYPAERLVTVEESPLSVLQKSAMIGANFLSRQTGKENLLERLYNLYVLGWIRNESSSSLNAMRKINDLKKELPRFRSGTFVLAHILLPHGPYVFDRNCAPRKNTFWRGSASPRGAHTVESRRLSYLDYFGQVECIHKQLEEIFSILRREGLYERSTILVHGDHGSRIGLSAPFQANASERDYRDYYATFFAIKPGDFSGGLPRAPEYRSEGIPLADLLQAEFHYSSSDDFHRLFISGEDRSQFVPAWTAVAN